MTAATITTSTPAPRLRRLPVPVSEPRPALRLIRDDDGSGPGTAVGHEQQSLNLTSPQLRLVPGVDPRPDGPTPRTRRDLVLRQRQESIRPGVRRASPGSLDDDDFCSPVATPTSQLPDPTRWAGQFVQAAVEVALGQRPVSQLVRWTSEDVHLALSRRAQLALRSGRRAARPRVQSVRGCSPRDGVVEACVIVNDSTRTRAVAVRLEGWDGRWRVTALQLG